MGVRNGRCFSQGLARGEAGSSAEMPSGLTLMGMLLKQTIREESDEHLKSNQWRMRPWMEVTSILSHLLERSVRFLDEEMECLSWGLNTFLWSFCDRYQEACWLHQITFPQTSIFLAIFWKTLIFC